MTGFFSCFCFKHSVSHVWKCLCVFALHLLLFEGRGQLELMCVDVTLTTYGTRLFILFCVPVHLLLTSQPNTHTHAYTPTHSYTGRHLEHAWFHMHKHLNAPVHTLSSRRLTIIHPPSSSSPLPSLLYSPLSTPPPPFTSRRPPRCV